MSAVMNSARRSITSPSLPIWEEGRPADPGTRWRSRPVSRILYPGRRRTGGPGGGHLSWSRVAATLVQPTREHRAGHPLPARPCSGWGLPSRPVTRPLVSSYLTVSPLPLFETVGTEHDLDRWAVCLCGTFRGSPRLGVAQHPALWSPDFPRRAHRRGRPADSYTPKYRRRYPSPSRTVRGWARPGRSPCPPRPATHRLPDWPDGRPR